MAITTLNNRSINRSDTASADQVWTATSATASDFQAAVGGITEADQWRLTASLTGTDGDITANLERVDTDPQGTLGTGGMSESSGIFTFPSTGYWLVSYSSNANNASAADNVAVYIYGTTDDSNYVLLTQAGDSCGGAAQNQTGRITCSTIFDVTDVSNVKVKFALSSFAAASFITGSTTTNYTEMTFIRLGDT